jgi:preprotein translocase subunit SecF
MAQRFRELIQPGSNIEFVGRMKGLLVISFFLCLASIALLPINAAIPSRGSMLNWTIDFKGGTEIKLTFAKPTSAGDIRKTLEGAGYKGVDVSTFAFKENGKALDGYLIQLAQFGSVTKEKGLAVADALATKFADRNITKASFSGDTMYVNSEKPISGEEFKAALTEAGLEMRPWSEEQAAQYSAKTEGTTEYHYQAPVYGIERGVLQALEQKLGEKVEFHGVDAVGPKAGEELRNDGLKSLVYAIAMIMLYIAFRFDFRYGPGTVASLLHDAILVLGVFAATYAEFSLTTVAAVLTVIGYSMNDTVVVFDRIRENEERYKDKKLDRIINISINETLSRTLLTSLATFSVTLAMNLLGTGLVKNFAFAMNVGIIVGTYSSILIAAPVLLWLHEKYYSKRKPVRRVLVSNDPTISGQA